MDDVYNNTDDYNPKRSRKILIIFDDMIADIKTNIKFQSIVKDLFSRCKKLNISLVFITQSHFLVPKGVRLKSTHYLIMKSHNKRELQSIAINHSADVDYKDFINIYREYTSEPYSFLTIDTALHYIHYKITLTVEVKILDDKIKGNQAQFNLDKEAAKTSALSSKE